VPSARNNLMINMCATHSKH